MSAPTRLIEDESLAPELRADLARAQEASSGSYDAAAGLALLQTSMKTGGSAASGSAGGNSLGLKLILGAGVVVGAAVLLWPGSESVEAPASTSVGAPVAPPVVEEEKVEPAGVDVPVDKAPVEATPIEATPIEAKPAPPSASLPAVAPAADPDELMKLEIAHLKQVRAASSSDPAEAIRLAREGHKKFRGGILYEEREGLLILSLQKMGRTAEAAPRAKKFAEQFPKSPLLPKMGALGDSATP